MSNLSLAVLRIRNFRLLLLTRVFATMAMQCQAVIVGWQVYSLTHDPFILGLTGLAEAVPAILCALVAGHIVDNGHPQRIYAACMGVLFVNTFLLLLVAGGLWPVPVANVLPWIFSGIFVSGLARSFTMPASFSLLPRLVPRSEISAASAWLGSGFNVAAICGPAIAGIIYGGYGPHGAWMLPTLLTMAGLATISTMHIHHSPPDVKREPAVQSITNGWKFILKNPVILSVMTLDMFAVLFGGAVAMLPAYADQVLHVGAEGLGALRAAPAIGAVGMALLLAIRPLKYIKTTHMLWAVAGFGLCMIGFGLSKLFWLSMIFLAVSGACDCISVVIRATVVQLLTPAAMTGRVASVKSMFIISSNEIGSFESGTAAKLFGLVPSVVIGGVCTLAVVGSMLIFSPRMRKTVIHADDD
jgi:MFS family permease